MHDSAVGANAWGYYGADAVGNNEGPPAAHSISRTSGRTMDEPVAEIVPDTPPSSFVRVCVQRELRRDGVADRMRSRRSLGEGGRIPLSPPPNNPCRIHSL